MINCNENENDNGKIDDINQARTNCTPDADRASSGARNL